MKTYNNGPRKAMMYGGAAKRKPMMYGGMATKKPRKKAQAGGMMTATPKQQNMQRNRMMMNQAMPATGMMAKGGKATKFGMLSVKAGIDDNPKPTAADRIAGATKGKKKTSA
jgi:hypothetical protein